MLGHSLNTAVDLFRRRAPATLVDWLQQLRSIALATFWCEVASENTNGFTAFARGTAPPNARFREESANGDSALKTKASVISSGAARDDAERMRGLRALAWLLDEAISLPGGYRIGLDPLIGLIPGVGDALGAVLSAYIVNEARRMGAPRSVLMRMLGNVLLEALVGAIPLAGDVFDAAYKANMRNLALLARYRLDPVGSRRSSRWFVLGFSLLLGLVVAVMIAIPVLIVLAMLRLF